MRLGILGGTFDPPHVGHLLIADDAFRALDLERLVFVPAFSQPLKSDRTSAPQATPEVRLAMVRALVSGDPRFEASAMEVERGGLSFTVDTLRQFAATYPSAERFLLLGADVIPTLAKWREPEVVMRLAQPVILERAGNHVAAPTLHGVVPRRVETRRVDVSSTEIRERVRRGLPIRGFVTDAVEALITQHELYR